MPSTNPTIHGLNIVHTQPPPSDDALDLTLPTFDIASHLDLWTHLDFASDEPFIAPRHPSIPADMSPPPPTPAESTASVDLSQNNTAGQDSPFDIGSFLAGFSVDPFLVPPSIDTSFNALLSMPQFAPPMAPASLIPAPQPAPAVPPQKSAKRARTRKTSLTSASASTPTNAAKSATAAATGSSFPDPEPNLTTPVTPNEDKRRRNTAASARFRLKKKEREAAMERRCRELESRVGELERECEGLRRENGWLKGLVVGVTGVNPTAPPSISAAPPAYTPSSGAKRKAAPELDEGDDSGEEDEDAGSEDEDASNESGALTASS